MAGEKVGGFQRFGGGFSVVSSANGRFMMCLRQNRKQIQVSSELMTCFCARTRTAEEQKLRMMTKRSH
jgi:hypothetical protein